jgi:hypothetical protein
MMNEATVTSQVRTQGARPERLAPVANLPGVQPRATAEQDVIVLPAVVNLSIYEGDDFWMDITIKDSTGAAVDVSQALPMSQIRPAPDDDTILANLGVTVDGTTVGLIHLHLLSSDSTLLPSSAAWDIQLTVPWIVTIAGGSVTVTPQVTQ